MSYAPPTGPHGGIPQQQPWGAAPPPPPYSGPAAPRKLLVGAVGFLIVAAVVSVFVFYVLWGDNMVKETGFTGTDDLKELPAPKGMGVTAPLVPGASVAGGGA
ncbi:hypothetical protein [Yinghuangia seranimata]|uniref:hypothetical protein n=1 Tax=Yinghuangia seranimata TaxID=408067 RepID=UPI00248B1C2E|nr:hypothetical protein [Yinghuangia seranimata]MDI2131739.1 hypothetical protein [Yinghuangia seranimata]